MNTLKLLGVLTLVGLSGLSNMARAASMPGSSSGSRLYYHLAGENPVGRAPYRGSQSVRLGLLGQPTLNYSCGKFDASLTVSELTNQYGRLGETVSNAVKAGVANLPMYILQRAQPGLYELIQTYMRKAEEAMQLAYKSCEQMQSETRDGKNPWDAWVTVSMGEKWRWQSSYGDGNVATAKDAVESDGGKSGFTWVYGTKAGGQGQPVAKVVSDTTVAAYNLTLGRATTASTTATTSTSTRLTAAFPTAADASRFATEVLGDVEVASCNDSGCPTKGTQMALGLQKQYEAEIATAQAQMSTVLSSSIPSASDLNTASAPGVVMTRDLVDSLRALPKIEQSMAASRLINEIALARTVDRALLLRQLLLSGQTIPALEASRAVSGLNAKVDELDNQIKSLMFEVNTRKQLVSGTASMVLDAASGTRAASTATAVTPGQDSNRLVNGRVVK